MSPLLSLIIIPVIAALFIIIGANARLTALLGAGLNFLLSVFLFFSYRLTEGNFQFVSSIPIAPAYGINFALGADGLSMAMLLLSTIVTLAAIGVARTPTKQPGWFYASLLFISAGAIGAFASTDAFVFYMFHELALIPTFLLIGIWGSGDRQSAAWKITIYLAFGSFVLLLGLIGLYSIVHTFDLRAIYALQKTGGVPAGQFSSVVYLLLFFGFGILVSLFPFHTWAPQAYASAPSPASMLHAGVLKKFGLYGILRIITPAFPPAVTSQFNNLLLILLLGNILYVGFVTITQRKLDLMLGYSSVMHMGYIFLGLLAWNTLGITGAAVMLVAHGLSVAALFALSGEIRERTHTLDFSELGGLARVMPAFGLLFGFAAMASIGLPGFANFPAEVMVFFGAFSGGDAKVGPFNSFQIATVIALWGVVISAIYMLRAYRHIFMGPLPERWKTLPEIGLVPKLCVAGLLLCLLIIGFHPQSLVTYINPFLMR